MKITKKWLNNKNACVPSFNHVCENGYIGLDGIDFVEKLIDNNRLSDANWLIVRVMYKKQKVSYAIFAAEQVLHIFEKRYSNDDRPKKAIEAAKDYLNNPCKKTKNAADAYADAAYDDADAYAADAAYAAYAAAYAAYAAYAADAADAYAYAAYAADAAAAAYAYADDAKDKMQLKILQNGIKLLKGHQND